jgi:hypothetical protein
MNLEPNIDNLQVEYAIANSLSLYKDAVRQGAKNWLKSAVMAAIHSPEITAYLFELFSNPNRVLLLTAYATIRYQSMNIIAVKSTGLSSLEEYITEEYKEQNAIFVFEAIAIGATINANRKLVEKCIAMGATNKREIALASIASGSAEIFAMIGVDIDLETMARTAVKYGNFEVLKSLSKKLNKELIEELIEISGIQLELIAYLRSL